MAVMTDANATSVRIGVALGSGSARGWSHIGVLRALKDHGIEPDIITGASVGALVAASYASDQLDELEAWVRSLTKLDVWRLLDATFSGGGVMSGNRLMQAINGQLEDCLIESLPIRFGAVAADLDTGEEIQLCEGSMLDAVRVSSGMPGLFTPVNHAGRWLIDGGVVNPVPVSLCRELGADYVIAVNLNRAVARRGKQFVPDEQSVDDDNSAALSEGAMLIKKWPTMLENFVRSVRNDRQKDGPAMIDVLSATINIMQNNIADNRIARDQPNLIVTPPLSNFRLMDFHRAAEAIDHGYLAVQQIASQLPRLTD